MWDEKKRHMSSRRVYHRTRQVQTVHDYENCFEDAFQLRHFQVAKNSFCLGFSSFFAFKQLMLNLFHKVLTFLILNYLKTALRNVIVHVFVL